MITASHNPKEYNGYKVYGADGGQMVPEAVEAVVSELENIQEEFMLKNRYNRVRNVKLIARNGHFFG